MTTHIDSDFQTYPPSGYSENGTVANVGQATSPIFKGPNSMTVNNGSAAQAWIADSGLTARLWSHRVYLWITTAVSGTASWWQTTNANGNFFLRLGTTNQISAVINTTTQTGPTLSTNRWYLIRWTVNSNASPATLDWMVDDAAQTQVSRVQAAANCTAHNLGIITSVTCNLSFAHYLVTDQVTDHPLPAVYRPYLPIPQPQLAQ